MKIRNLGIIIFILTSIVFADTTFFKEDFNSSWNTTTPPTSWTIFYQAPAGNEDWHRDSAGVWTDNHSGYAKISYGTEFTKLSVEDSLISPIIYCQRFRDIVLRCSTSFRHLSSNYSAKIIASVDGGITYPHLIRNYWGNYLLPQLETISLDWAAETDSIRIAFVFTGSIEDIEYWCLDNISLTGTYIYDTDVACSAITSPQTIQLPGFCTINIQIANLGKNQLENFAVGCTIYDWTHAPIHYAEVIVDTLRYHETLDLSLAPVIIFPSLPGAYQTRAWCAESSDQNKHNDTLEKDFSVAWTQSMQHCVDNPVAGEHFEIGEQGYGVKFTPTVYPARINQVECYLSASVNPITYYQYKIRIVDDDGVDSAPGTTLYETSVIDGADGWNTAYLFTDDIYIYDGSFYIFYIQTVDAPYAPNLFYDDLITPAVRYYRYYENAYSYYAPAGDWLLHIALEYTPPSVYNNDIRTVYIDQPLNEFVRRPFDYSTIVKARIENVGVVDQFNFAVSCTVKSYLTGEVRQMLSTTVPQLAAGHGMDVDLAPVWNVRFNEQTKIIVCTHLLFDENPDNDLKTKLVQNSVGIFTGHENTTGYAWYDADSTNGPVFNWIDTFGASMLTDFGDDTIIPLVLPFSFKYNDSSYSHIFVSTNGFLSFQSSQPSSPVNSAIPSTDLPNCALYPLWDDLVLPADQSAKILYKLQVSGPDSIFAVTWHNIARQGTDYSERFSFQILLSDDGKIYFQYKNVTCNHQAANYGKSATIGIENNDGTRGLEYLYCSENSLANWPENKLRNNFVIKFYKQLRDIAPTLILSPSDSIVPGPTTPYISVKNFGTEPEETLKVFLKIYSMFNSAPIYDTFQFIPRLNPSEQRTIVYPDWDADLGKYILVCSTGLNHDQNQANDLLRDSSLVLTWIMKAPIPFGSENRLVKNSALVYANAFNKIYALKGGGTCNEFWCYDIATNSWESLPRMPLEPSGKKPKAGCALTYDGGNRIYALKGNNTTDFYAYNIISAQWEILLPFQDSFYIPRKKPKEGSGLSYSDGMIYAIMGNTTHIGRYNPAASIWQHEYTIEAAKKIRDGGSITSNNGVLYIFNGNNTKYLYRYDISSSQLLPTCTIPGKYKVKSGGASTMQTSTGFIYFFIGGSKQYLWAYNTAHNLFDTTLTPIPLNSLLPPKKTKIKKGASLVATPLDLIYVFKSGNTREFWAYAYWGEPFLNKDDDKLKNDLELQNQPTGIVTTISNIISSSNSSEPVTIRYSVIKSSDVKINIYSVSGELVKTLFNQNQNPGTYELNWDGKNADEKVVKGIYFIKGSVDNTLFSCKIVKI